VISVVEIINDKIFIDYSVNYRYYIHIDSENYKNPRIILRESKILTVPVEEIQIGDKIIRKNFDGFEYGSELSYYTIIDKKNVNYSTIVDIRKTTDIFRKVPCVASSCIVTILDGEDIPCDIRINNIKIGNFILTSSGFKKVSSILETIIPDGVLKLYCKDGLFITGKHPIKYNGIWQFPSNLPDFNEHHVYTDNIFSLAVDNSDNFLVGNIEVITLGHNIKNDPVATHDFIGTDLVIEEIKILSHDRGHLIIKPSNIIRDYSGIIGIEKEI